MRVESNGKSSPSRMTVGATRFRAQRHLPRCAMHTAARESFICQRPIDGAQRSQRPDARPIIDDRPTRCEHDFWPPRWGRWASRSGGCWGASTNQTGLHASNREFVSRQGAKAQRAVRQIPSRLSALASAHRTTAFLLILGQPFGDHEILSQLVGLSPQGRPSRRTTDSDGPGGTVLRGRRRNTPPLRPKQQESPPKMGLGDHGQIA